MTTRQTFQKLFPPFVHPGLGFRHLFAHGELLIEGRLRSLCPGPEFISTGFYDGRKWIVNRSGAGTIVPRRGCRVFGAIWRVHEVAVAALDIHFGVPVQSERFGAFATLSDGRRCTAEYYGARDREPGTATEAYLLPIVETGRKLGFPEGHLEELSAWLDAPDGG